MKKLTFTITFCALVCLSFAQTEEGSLLVGASSNLGFTSTSQDGFDENRTEFNFSPAIGYFVADNLSIGVALDLQSSKLGDFKSSSTAIGPFARYYFDGLFYVGAGYGALSVKNENNGGSVTTNGGLLSFEAGYPIWIVDNIAIEPSLNYAIGSGDLLEDISIFGLAVGFNIYL